MCVDPAAMCERVWLMIVTLIVVCVCRLSESVCVSVYVCEYPGRWARWICFLL